MKKIALILSLIFLSSLSLNAEDPLSLEQIETMIKAEAEKQVAPVLDLFTSGLNSGIYAPVSGKILSFGIQFNAVSIKNEGVLKDIDLSVLPLPFAYLGIRIPAFGINAFFRGIGFPYEGKTMKIIGFGAGWEPTFIPVISIKMLIHYHMLRDFPFIDVNSIGGTIIGALTAIPLVTPYATLGLNNTSLTTKGLKAMGTSEEFTMDNTAFLLGVGLKLLKVVTAEVQFIPAMTYSLSLGLSF
ncbi:MAG: hypothetical protein PHF84_07880 [bacterium]|nr:hypothetical protein [bacterium]